MFRITKWLLLLSLLTAFCGLEAHAQTINAASCNTSDVQTAINTATEGQTVTIPAGTCTWTSGVTISGKGITVQGAGSGRIIAVSSTTLTLGSGTKTLTVTGADPGITLSISNGQTLTLYETGTITNYMTGTVTSYASGTGTLVMNITSSGGTCGANGLSNCKRWLVSTPSTTTLINNMAGSSGGGASSSNTMFWIAEDTSSHTDISGFKIAAGTGGANGFGITHTSGGQAVLLHDWWMELNRTASTGPMNAVNVYSNEGVIWNCSVDPTAWTQTSGSISQQDPQNLTVNSWTSVSQFGMNDTTGQGNLYIEDCDFHAQLYAIGPSDNGREVARYNLFDNSALGTHGADTAQYGQRYFEFYNNVGVFEGYNDGTTFNMQDWFFVRGGTFVIHDNTLPALSSTDYGTKPDINMTVMNLQHNAGPDPCWGAGTSNGADYHAPRQVGFGYVTGTGKDGLGRTNDPVTYAGDSEPGYIWANSRQPLGNVTVSDYGGTECANPDTSVNYIVSGRDYFNGSTAKPGYTPYTYPHPLRQGSGSAPAPPTGLAAVVE